MTIESIIWISARYIQLRSLSKSIIVLLITLSSGQTTHKSSLNSFAVHTNKILRRKNVASAWTFELSTNPKLRTFNLHLCTYSYHSLPESQSEEKLTFYQRMSLIEMCFCLWLNGILLTFWQTIVRKYASAKVRSSKLKVLCVNVVHEHLHYTDLNHSAVEQYNRRSHSGGIAATAVSKVLEKKSHCWLFLRNSPDIWVGFFLLGSLDFMNVMNKKLQLCERPTVHVVHYTK